MPIKTWVGRFAIVKGQPQEEGPYLRSFPRQRPDEEEDELYVLVDPASPASEQYCEELADVIGRAFRQDTLSVTGAVLRAIKGAHQQLYDWNQRSLPEHRVGAGVSCLAVRGRTAYLAQVGPAVAYHVADGHFQTIAPADGATAPLGHEEQNEPAFSRYQLEPGDVLLLVPPRIQELLDEDTIRSILMRGGDEALVELFRLTRDEQDFNLILLACVVEPEAEAGAPLPEALAVSPAGPEDEAGAQPGAPAPPSIEQTLESASAAAAAEAEAQAVEAAASAEAQEPPAGLARPKVRLKGDDAAVRYASTTGLRASLPRVPLLAVLGVLALIAAGLLAWQFIPPALQESRDEQFDTLVAEAQAAFATAQASDDPAARREALEQAAASLAEAEQIQANDLAVARLRAEVDAAVLELNAVLELPPLDLITDVSARVPGAFESKDLAIGGGGAYLLDRQQQRVIALSLLAADPEPAVLLSAGEPVGTELAGEPQHIVWAEELDGLLVLDGVRRLIFVRFGEAPRPLTVRGADEWGSADGIAFSQGNLYVLDRESDQVWLYRPTESGFDSEREPLLPAGGADLENVSELTVNQAVYLVTPDGAILRFQGGVPLPFTQAGIDVAMISPASVVPLPGSDRVLVADRGNQRIVVFSQEGAFRQQLKSQTFTNLRALAVDEPHNLVYILEGGALYRTALPPSPPLP